MGQAGNGPVAAAETKARRQNIFLSALKFGAVLALINTFVDGLRIWREAPPQAYLGSSSGAAGAGLMAYRLSTLGAAAITNLIMWFVAALIMLFVLRQLKKA